MWPGSSETAKPDTHALFQGSFKLTRNAIVSVQLLSIGPALLWLDGKLILDGPIRYAPGHPEYISCDVDLDKGEHQLELHYGHEGVTTRIMPQPAPLVACRIEGEDGEVATTWKGALLPGFASQVRRVNPQLGWIEWCDTARNPSAAKDEVVFGNEFLAPHASIEAPRLTVHNLKPIATGPLAETFGYEQDDPTTRFFLRDQHCKQVPSEGEWRRYDLGQVRLGRPRFTLDLPPGTVVEFATSESLAHGRVQPWITLSAGQSCNMDHYTAKGGVQTFIPVAAKGGRFLEVHVLAANPKFLEEEFVERHYHGEPEGRFHSGDKLLDRIWQVGINTHRACSEDTMIDNPTRERGQWAGDVGSVGLEVAAVAHADLRLLRRGLIQCAQCAREDGLVAGLCPGGDAYLSTYAAQWVSACLRYWEVTGDRGLLDELFPAAQKNVDAFIQAMSKDGVGDGLGWAFIDWGYVRNEGPTDMALNLHVLLALRDMVRWSLALHKSDKAREMADKAHDLELVCSDWLRDKPVGQIGFHRVVLALRAGLLKDRGAESVALIKDHYRKCFPNNKKARRLSSPSLSGDDFITPYFSHFALAELWELGEGDFVLDQYRSCWGWALQDDRTTWVEVFDPRFSHCHGWSACPTWQLSRFVLGLRPRWDLGDSTYDFEPRRCSLKSASGRLPLPISTIGGGIDVSFIRQEAKTKWRISSKHPIFLRTHIGDIHVDGVAEFELE